MVVGGLVSDFGLTNSLFGLVLVFVFNLCCLCLRFVICWFRVWLWVGFIGGWFARIRVVWLAAVASCYLGWWCVGSLWVSETCGFVTLIVFGYLGCVCWFGI